MEGALTGRHLGLADDSAELQPILRRERPAIRRKPVLNSSLHVSRPRGNANPLDPSAEAFLPQPALYIDRSVREEPAISVSREVSDIYTTNNDFDRKDDSKQPFDSISHIHPTKRRRSSTCSLSPDKSWSCGVFGGLIIALVVLTTNTTLLGWVHSRFDVTDNIAVVFTGSCSKSSAITTYAELAINISSTLLLAASNNCSQILASPTRAEVDKAHAVGSWVHIAAPSYRNFKWISSWRVLLWFLLFASSIPLHLLYNSVIYSSSYTNDVMTALVTENFQEGGWWNETAALNDFTSTSNLTAYQNNSQAFTGALTRLQTTVKNLTKLDNDDCQSTFISPNLQSSYLNVLVVTNYTRNSSFIAGALHTPELGIDGQAWFNATNATHNASQLIFQDFNPGMHDAKFISNYSYWNYSHGDTWRFPASECAGSSCNIYPAWVQYCLAQSSRDLAALCTVSISTSLLLAVIICNVIKVMCLSATLINHQFRPLVTFGDAVNSFIDRPDPTTAGCGPFSLSHAQDLYLGRGPLKEGLNTRHEEIHVWKGKKGKWVSSLNLGFTIIVYMGCGGAWVAILVLLSESKPGNLVASWSHDVTLSVYPELAESTDSPRSLAANVLLINTPQLAVSLIYVFYNSALTRMFVASEGGKFAKLRKVLRVSSPRGGQRSTYWLQLPYRYILPIMTSMALLHWFISRGIYLINIKVYDIAGQEAPNRTRFSYGTSRLALLFAFLLGTVLLAFLLGTMNRKFESGIPIFGTCSLAISAACHLEQDDVDAAIKPLMYGVVKVDSLRHSQAWHVCFSSKDIDPLQDGATYY